MAGDDANWDAAALEADFDALLDLEPGARAAALADIGRREPQRAQALRRWLEAVSASSGLLAGSAAPQRSLERVGPWRLEGLIGRGGAGEVYLGRRADGAFERQVAVKLLRADRNADALIVAERRLLARLAHPHIAGLLDGGIADDGRPYLVTEHVVGRALDDWIRSERPSLEQRLRVFSALAEAVAYAHANGVVHADLKPANVLIDAGGQPKLLDFGIAQLLDQENGGAPVARLTPAWAAPEQFDGAEASPRTDVYALGSLLYLLLSDSLAHASAQLPLAELKARRQAQDPPPPSTRALAPGIPARRLRGDLDAIALRCLARDPARRYSGVTAILADLRAWQQHRPVLARAGGRGYRVRRWLRRHWVAVLVALLTAGVLAWQQSRLALLEAELQSLQRPAR